MLTTASTRRLNAKLLFVIVPGLLTGVKKKESSGIERATAPLDSVVEVNFGPKNKKVFRLQEPEDFVVTRIRHAFVPTGEFCKAAGRNSQELFRDS
jgi:hypothetical protein